MTVIFSATDPYRISPLVSPYEAEFKSIEGRTREAAHSAASTLTLLSLGQSNIGNYVYGSYSPTGGAGNLNLSVFDGGLYRAVDGPIIGPNGNQNSVLPQLADLLISGEHADRVVNVPVAVGGTFVADWAPGGLMHHRAKCAALRALSLGLVPDAVLWQQGENDASASTTESAYIASLTALKDALREYGVDCPIVVARGTWGGGEYPPNYLAVRAAQTNIVDGVDFFAGPDTDTLGNTYRADGTHFNATGATAAAALWRDAILAAI